MIKASEPITNPAEAAARPESEFKKVTTTGMSAPPIGSVRVTPRTAAKPVKTQNGVGPPETTIHAATPRTAAASAPSKKS